MSTATHAHPGKPSFGGLLARIMFIVLLWAALVTGTLHYVGYAWPKAYQISQAEKAQAEEKEMTALNPPAPEKPAAAASTPAAPATSATPAAPASTATAATATTAPTAAPAAASAAPAAPASSASPASPATTSSTAAAPASTAAPAAASAPKAATGEQKLPFDLRLAGYNRTALENVSIFFSIVISAFCVGGIILQIFKYKHVEEDAAH